MNPKVDWFFDKDTHWQEAYAVLRELVLATGLQEELKWGCPCYVRGKNNIVLIHGFKDYCALLFMQGALLKDPKKKLIQQTKNVQAARQFRFADVEEVRKNKSVITALIKEAIAMDKAGLKVQLKKTAQFEMPKEFHAALKAMPDLKKAFHALTPGRQRGYLLYFSSAKQAQTREARVEKYIPKILNGKGLED
ncbi:MAG TPA: YdeI/OmpD-associated family protein [Cyclobacteriaceae bacterium]|nr:YdeI/OmpD-associated family protein [Cyclobacteriaceae bacterium]